MTTGIVELRNSHLDGNRAIGGGPNAPGNGGGLHVTGRPGQVGYIRFFGGTVNDNLAATEGGGLWNQAGNIMVVRQAAVVSGNAATGEEADDGGGGIFNNGGRLSIGEGAQITNNHANGALGSGGGIFSTHGGVSVAGGALVSGNSAVRAGGGIELVRGLVTITDSTIQLNAALGGGAGAPGNGGGIHVTSTTGFPRVDLINSVIDRNTAATSGGGLWMQSSSVVLVRIGSQVTANEAHGPGAADGGGGIFNQGGRLVINNASIVGNLATGALGSGGGILTLANVTTVENGSLFNNSAIRAGGGVEVINGHFESRNATFNSNRAVGGGAGAPGNGGGIHVTGNGVRVNIFDSHIVLNTAASQGGGLWNQSGSVMVIAEQSHISANSAGAGNVGDGGGGIFNNGGRLAVVSTLISGSEADGQGGGIYSTGGGVSVDNSTLAFNNATGDGGGIFSLGNLTLNNSTIAQGLADRFDAGSGTGGGIFNGGTATLRNTLVLGNGAGNASSASDVVGNNLSVGSRNTLIGDAATAGGLTDGVGGHIIGINGAGVRPIFSVINPLADNGGPRPTYSLAVDSPALNGGDNVFARDASGFPLNNDQRGFGFSRIVGGIVDLGAFEMQ